MNLQTFNLFLIVLSILLASSITVDARWNNMIIVGSYNSVDTISNAADCCLNCTINPSCLAWNFDQNECFQITSDRGGSCSTKLNSVEVGGTVRCGAVSQC
ncbi:20500_t:CDS:2 [Cetraspora pellucida]|uniref:20500_t:CDS:1 n=1 Tax=Cetraspora pellucida TaxID=1433469 RepID=A0A9N9CY79_9GLOM|nr:20500_t:CDS:2 [Cetraspora pellucida]